MVNVKRDGFHYVVASWSCLVAGREQGAWWLRVAGELWRLTWLRLTLRLYRRAIQLTGGLQELYNRYSWTWPRKAEARGR